MEQDLSEELVALCKRPAIAKRLLLSCNCKVKDGLVLTEVLTTLCELACDVEKSMIKISLRPGSPWWKGLADA